jgi:NADH:ubiquinone oxidoreductase subunit E
MDTTGEAPMLKQISAQETLDTILSSFEGKESELIPILQQAEAEFSCLPDEIIRGIARFTGVPESSVYAVATFYDHFHFRPVGTRQVTVCRGTACYVMGGAKILNAVERQLGIKEGETTEDLEYSLGTIGCTGTCAHAPCIMIDNKVESKMNPEKVARLLPRGSQS